MIPELAGKSLDDLYLIPTYSEIVSRSDPDFKVTIGELEVYPIISANMDRITEAPMAIAMWQCGALGALHRFMSIEENVSQYNKVRSQGAECFVSLGVKDWEPRARALFDVGARYYVIDIAHAHSILVKTVIKGLRKLYGSSIYIMAGNVATAQAVASLVSWGADCIKGPIGGGSCCKTRVVTGFGPPNAGAIYECSSEADRLGVKFIADGGMKDSGTIMKAFALGADAVMVGSLLAGATETPGEIIIGNGQNFKQYRGMASSEVNQDRQWGSSEVKVAPEGVSALVPEKGYVRDIIHETIMGIKSAMSYCNAKEFKDISKNANWGVQTPSAYYEGLPHILTRR